MMNFKTIMAGSVAALIAGTALSPAMAAPGFGGSFGKKMSSQFFTNFDTNKDGSVTTAEIEAKRKADFAKADTAGDGAITLEEWKVFAADRSSERSKDRSVRIFQRFDSNGDGQVTREEFLDQAERMTARMDKMKKRMGDRMAKMQDGKGGKGSWGDGPRDGKQGKDGWQKGPRDGKQGGKGMRGEMMGAMFAKVDLDKNGQISKDELSKLADQLFANGPVDLAGFRTIAAEFKEPMYVRSFQRLDANGDLKVTQEEFFAPTAQMMKRMDRNNDGVITSADFTKMKKDWRKGQKDRKGGHGHGYGKGQGQRG
ncbi:transaldolase/EF-hand domain-containing protein [Pseudovibrio sp. Ad46]|uniref:EF-hand domain-containing protein n=1 Tax=Pseudovibrio sp. Ad46 TaxID=989432 RepID=UPI0007AECC4D|nr:EF-hand domain-containing protein [Pseudovibrio sp. Ad46]KZK86331.1 transaldolase/EF-hand domain-containing protein [Pseudovibrio sp. Ad46]